MSNTEFLGQPLKSPRNVAFVALALFALFIAITFPIWEKLIKSSITVTRWMDARERNEQEIISRIEALDGFVKSRVVGQTSRGWHRDTMKIWVEKANRSIQQNEPLPDPYSIPWFNPDTGVFEDLGGP